MWHQSFYVANRDAKYSENENFHSANEKFN